jgi:hypothetical protein
MFVPQEESRHVDSVTFQVLQPMGTNSLSKLQ